MTRLEDAYVNGHSHVTWDEFYLWYGAERLHKRFWADLQDRWLALQPDVEEDDIAKLYVYDGRGGLGLINASMLRVLTGQQAETSLVEPFN